MNNPSVGEKDKFSPAIIEYGHKEWYLKGKLHREDGPAVEYAYDGFKSRQRRQQQAPVVCTCDIRKLWRSGHDNGCPEK